MQNSVYRILKEVCMTTDKINFKLDNGKYGVIGFNDFNNQIKREQLKNKKQQAIFDRLDNGSKILEQDEIEGFKSLLAHYIQNDNLSKEEADKFLKTIFDEKPDDINVKDLFGFIQALVKTQTTQVTTPVGKTTETVTDESGQEITVETITDENGNVTKNFYNSDGKKIKQEKNIDGETMTVEYDGKGNTKVIVQNREGFKSLSELFGVDKHELIELNKDKIRKHPRTGRKFFLVGEEILIPREVEADEAILKGRKDKAGAIQDWIDERNGHIHPSPTPNPTPDPDPTPNPNPTPTPEPDPTPNPNPNPTPEPDPTPDPEPTPEPEPIVDIEDLKRKEKINKKADKIANKLYDICDNNSAAIDKDIFWKELNKINKDNIIAVLDNYDKVVEEKKTDSSLLDTICSEVGASNENRMKACNKIFDTMAQAAKEAGVSESEIKHAKKEFQKSLQHEFDKIGRVNTKDMEKSLDFLRGATAAAKVNAKGTAEMSTAEAMKAFIEGEDGLVALNNNVQKMYKDAREEEGWVAKAGDSICGLFGCTTIEDMDEKLGKYAKDVKKLEKAAKSGDEEQFLKLYKKIFGIDFNPKAIQARQKAQENLEQAATLDASLKAFTQLEAQTKNMNFAQLSQTMKEKLQFSDEELEQVITNYAQAHDMNTSSDEEKLAVLQDFIKTSKETSKEEFLKLSEGKTLEQMTKDMDLLTKAAYGTNDIVKDVMQFNENQLMTDMITSAAFEIGGTIALQFVPGLGQLATAKLAVNAAKWGVKGAKIANAANKISKGFGAYNKFANSSKIAKVATNMAAAGVATAAVNLTNKKDIEETLRKTLMNMSFAGVGAASSMLAPKLMQAFGMSNAVATEVAEEIINTAGAYGITTLSGSDYTTQDGFIDFASGIVMSRIAHTKLHKPTHPEVEIHPEVDPHTTKPEIDIDTDVDIPTPEKPTTVKLFGEDTNIVGIETNKKGQKVLISDKGLKITVDDSNKPISAHNPKSGETATYNYDTNDEFIGTITKNKHNKIVKHLEKQGSDWVEKDYKLGKEYLLGSDKQTILVERYLKLSEYPPNALIPDPATFSKNLSEQIDSCNDIDKLNELKSEYSTYQSQYGKLDNDLWDKFLVKASELSKAAVNKPHKPKSKIITDPSFESKIEKWSHFKKYGKNGIPLKYPHDTFVSDLETALNSLSPAEKSAVMKDLNIEFVSNGSKKELKGIPNLDAKVNSPAHQKVMDILNKYAKDNEIMITSPPGLKAELENFIKDVPEFSFMIGKAQNGIHSYSLDVHTMLNLQNALKQIKNNYPNLSEEEKEILKMSILLHDMGKQFKGISTSDTGHAALSKAYAEKILERFNYPQSTKDRILKLVENHHWFKEFNKGNMSADDVINMFGSDLTLAKIMAKSDLESVSDTFHLTILEPGKTLTQYEYEKLFQQKMDSIVPSAGTFIGHELPIGTLNLKEQYILDPTKVDKLILGNKGFEFDINDPQFKKLCASLNEGESFAIGCTNPKTTYDDVKLQIGKYEDGVGSHHIVVTKKGGKIIIEPRKDVTVVKDIPTKVTSDPVLKAEIDKMRAKATKITTRTLNVDGKQIPFEILEGTKSGSNDGFFAINKITGEMFYAKNGGGQSKAELLAAQLYKQAGVNVPEITSFTDADGSIGILSKFEPGLKPITSASALVNDQFGMDVLTANWDAVVSNNTCLTKDGKAICIDVGGTMDFHANQNSSKPFTAIPQELLTFFDGHNSTAAHIYSKLTREDLIKSLEKAVSLKDKDITSLAAGAGVPHYADILIKRKKFLKNFLEELKKDPTPMGADKHAFIQKKYGSALEKMIEQAKSDDDLEDVKQALGYLKDKKLYQDLTNKLDTKSKQIAGTKPKLKYLTETQVVNMLTKFGFVKDSMGNYKVILPESVKNQLYNRYGSYSSKVIAHIESTLTASDITKIQTIMNAANGQFISIYQNDMATFLHLYKQIKGTNIFSYLNEMNTGEWETFANLIKNPIDIKTIEAIDNYKGSGYMTINNALEKMKKQGIAPTGSTKDKIDALQSYISTQVIHTPVTIRRNEGYEVFRSVKLPNGKTLDKAMEEAYNAWAASGYKDKTPIEKLKQMVNSGDYTASQEHFMSATIAGPAPFYSYPVHWEITVEKGSKGVLLEGAKVNAGLGSETEILIQKDSEIKILGLDFDYTNKKWKPVGSLTN